MRQAQELSVTFSVLTDDPLLGIGSGGASLDQPAVTSGLENLVMRCFTWHGR